MSKELSPRHPAKMRSRASRQKLALLLHIRGQTHTSIAADLGVTRQTIALDIKEELERVQVELRDDLQSKIAESYLVYKDVRNWGLSRMHDETVEMRERISCASLILRGQERIDKLTGAEAPEKMLVQHAFPKIELEIHYPDQDDPDGTEPMEAEIV